MNAQFHKAFENAKRLHIMSILMANAEYDFNAFKEILDITDGNLASHLKYLENTHFIEVKKSFRGRKPLTQYNATEQGKKAFSEHIAALEKLINSIQT